MKHRNSTIRRNLRTLTASTDGERDPEEELRQDLAENPPTIRTKSVPETPSAHFGPDGKLLPGLSASAVTKLAEALLLQRRWALWFSERVKKVYPNPFGIAGSSGRPAAEPSGPRQVSSKVLHNATASPEGSAEGRPEDSRVRRTQYPKSDGHHDSSQNATKASRGDSTAGDPFAPPNRKFEFASIAAYWLAVNPLPVPSKLLIDINIYMFQDGTSPTWEHADNVKGGRWTFSVDASKPADADAAWLELHMALVGETLDVADNVVGIALARRRRYTRLSVWTKRRDDAAANLKLGAHIKALVMRVARIDKLEYQDHGDEFDASGATYRHVL